MSSCRVGEHSRYELVLAVVRYILIDGHVLRNSGSRVEILKKDEFIFVHKMLYHTNVTSYLQQNRFPELSFCCNKIKHKSCIFTLL